MKVSNISKDISLLEKSLKREKSIRFTLLFILGVLTLLLIIQKPTTAVILEPVSQVKNNCQIEKYEADACYLERFTNDMISLLVIYSPETARRNFEALLSYVAPEDFGEMDKFTLRELERIKKHNVSSVFYPKEFKFDLKNQAVVATGSQKTFSGSKIIFSGQKTFRFNYKVNNYKIMLKGFKDVTNQKNQFEGEQGDAEI